MTEWRRQPDYCPHCGALSTGTSALNNDEPPEPGDSAICIECGRWIVFDENLRFRPPNQAELLHVLTEPEHVRAFSAWAMMDAMRRLEAEQ